MMSDSNLTYNEDLLISRLAFSRVKGITPSMASDLLKVLGTENEFFNRSETQLSSLIGKKLHIFERPYRDSLVENATAELKFIKAHGIKPIYIYDSEYPGRLAECPDAPLMLYTMGNLDLNAQCFISIVGTRHITPYGMKAVRDLVEELASTLEVKPVIVSGLAIGVDICAHKTAIDCGLDTVAVLAHGLNTIYPAMHRAMAADIARNHGMLITEFTSADVIHRGNFLTRNRIIAGMSDCTVIAESAVKGGAMVTARLAFGYNRDVFAVPGRQTDAYSLGCNRLIAENVAHLLDEPSSLIETMGLRRKPSDGIQQELPIDLTADEKEIVDYLLSNGEKRVNQISVDLNRPVAKVMATLVELEFKGAVIPYPGGLYCVTS